MAALQLVEPMLGQNVFSLSALMELPTMAAQKWQMRNHGVLPWLKMVCMLVGKTNGATAILNALLKKYLPLVKSGSEIAKWNNAEV